PIYNLKPKEFAGLTKWFNEQSFNGKLTKLQLKSVLSSYGLTPTYEELQQMIDAVSVDSSGIDLQTFLGLCSVKSPVHDHQKEIQDAFRIFDQDGSGAVDAKELRYAMNRMGNYNVDIHNMLGEMDTNKDGLISCEEFCSFMEKKLLTYSICCAYSFSRIIS
ncbi:unnamed protein product, partial [Owenia fusiformis]